jgi:hypothetical protein
MMWGSNPNRSIRFFFSPKCLDCLWDPPSLLFNGYQGYFPELKWQGHEVNHSLTCSAEIKNEWSCTYPPFVIWTGAIFYLFMNDILLFPFPLQFLQLIFISIRVIKSREMSRVCGKTGEEKKPMQGFGQMTRTEKAPWKTWA